MRLRENVGRYTFLIPSRSRSGSTQFPTSMTPALEIAQSTFPNLFNAASKRAMRSSYFVTSVLKNSTGKEHSFRACCSPASACMSPNTTLAPKLQSLSTVAAPMPLLPPERGGSINYSWWYLIESIPVITTTLSLKFPASNFGMKRDIAKLELDS